MKKLVYLVLLLSVLACKKVADPTLVLSSQAISLGDITSASKSSVALTKNGKGSITYTVVSDKSWLVIDNAAGDIVTSDSVKFHVAMPNTSLVEGENIATLTVTPTINGNLGTASLIRVSGNFKSTSMSVSSTSLDFGAIKTTSKKSILLSKTGLENVNYDVSSDATWLTVLPSSGVVNGVDSLVLTIDNTNLLRGAFSASVTITPKILGVAGTPIVIPVSGLYDNSISGDITGHTLTKDEYWVGNINLLGTVIVPNGINLTILPGTKINIAKQVNLVELTVFGNLIMNGESNKIIELKSAVTTGATNSDWSGIRINGSAKISYALIKNAHNALNFEDFVSGSAAPPVLNYILFDNDLFAIFKFKSNVASSMSNLSFRNIFYFSINIKESPQTYITACEFLDPNGYIDILMDSNNSNINLNRCNFVIKKTNSLSQLEVSSSVSNNTISALSCFQIITKNGFNSNGNTFIETNQVDVANANIGCGFTSQYPSARLK